jgi:PTS system mannose-specific IIB component
MISLIRIDDRLIHGQIMAVWVRMLRIDHILVADDATAADSFSQQMMQFAMSDSITLTVSDIVTAAGKLAQAASDSTHTLVLLRSVDAAVRLHAAYPFRELNVGGIGMLPGRKLVWRSIAASPAELAALRRLRTQGVNVYLQMIPTDDRKLLTLDF